MDNLCNNSRFVKLMLIFAYPIGIFALYKNKLMSHKFRKAVLFFYPWHLLVFPIYVSFFNATKGDTDTPSAIVDTWAYLLIFSVPIFIITAIVLSYKKRKKRVINRFADEKIINPSPSIQNNINTVDWKIGDSVNHDIFGLGVISDIRQLNGEKLADVFFKNSGNKTLYLSTEQLKRVETPYTDYNFSKSSLSDNTGLIQNTVNASANNFPYEKANLLTNNERNFYETIRLISEKHNFNVLSKVRLADIVNVNENVKAETAEWWNYFKKISQKHVDFALADKSSLEIKLVIEVDDSSHKQVDRIERDLFVDKVLKNVGVPILHIENVIGLEEKIIKILNIDNISEKIKLER